MSRHTLTIFVLLVGCKGCEDDTPLPTVLSRVGGAPVALWAGSSSGAGAASVPVVRVDELGAPTGGNDANVTSTATLGASTVSFDASGWGAVQASGSVGAHAVTVSDGALSAEGWAFVTDRADVALAFPAWLGGRDGGLAVVAGNGVVFTQGGEAWWFPARGGAGVRVLALDQDVLEVLPVHLDADGVTDALLWSASEVVLLRGRSEGGVGYWAAFEVVAGSVGAASVVDLDGDAYADLVVAVNGAGSASVAWMPGDGLGGYTVTGVLETDYTVYGVSAEDFDKSGTAELTVLTEDGLLRRYDKTDDGWQAASQTDFSLGVARDTRMLGGRDLTEDLWPDVVVAGPLINGDGALVYVTSHGGTSTPVSYRLVEGEYDEAAVAVVDADVDSRLDLFVAADGVLERAAWSDSSGVFSVTTHSSMPAFARIDVADIDADGLADVVYPGSLSFAVMSSRRDDDPDTAENEAMAWTTRTPTAGVFSLDLVGTPWAGDFNGDGVVDLVSFTSEDGLSIGAYYGDPELDGSVETFRSASAELVGASALPLDLAVCDAEAWVLARDGDVSTLYHYALDGFGTLSLLGSLEVVATQVACGNFEGFAAAAVSPTGAVTLVATDGTTATDDLDQDVVELAAGDVDGDGYDELHACSGACSVAVGDVSGDGLDDLLVDDGTGAVLTISGVAYALGAQGSVSLYDADGDGVLDANVQAGGVALAWRGLGGRPGVPMGAYMLRPVAGPALRGDLDGNGVPDLFYLGDERDEADGVDWTGTLMYAEAPDPED